MADDLDPAQNPYIHVEDGQVFLADRLVVYRPMNVQDFLDKKGSGLAKVEWRTGLLGMKKMSAARWIEDIAVRYRLRPEFILTLLQAEQSLVTDAVVRPPMADIIVLPDKTETSPSVPAGYIARRNGGYWDDRNKNRPGWIRKVSDGNWWLAVKGDWKMIAAVGAGIPDPGVFPAWDVRKYLGFDKQIEAIGKLTEKYYTQFNEAVRRGDLAGRSVTLYDKRTVVAGDPETFTLLSWTPAAQVLSKRPQIAKAYMA